MADFVFNIAKGRVAELYNRVKSNDPANSAIVIVAINRNGASDATMKDYADLAALIGDVNVAEATNTNYARKVLTDADLAALAVDNANDRMPCDLSNQSWLLVGATGGAWTDLVICYDSDTTAGTDASIIPMTSHVFAVTPDGNDIVATVADFYRAS